MLTKLAILCFETHFALKSTKFLLYWLIHSGFESWQLHVSKSTKIMGWNWKKFMFRRLTISCFIIWQFLASKLTKFMFRKSTEIISPKFYKLMLRNSINSCFFIWISFWMNISWFENRQNSFGSIIEIRQFLASKSRIFMFR